MGWGGSSILMGKIRASVTCALISHNNSALLILLNLIKDNNVKLNVEVFPIAKEACHICLFYVF